MIDGGWSLRQLDLEGLVTKRGLLVAPFLAALAFAPILGAAHNLGRLLA